MLTPSSSISPIGNDVPARGDGRNRASGDEDRFAGLLAAPEEQNRAPEAALIEGPAARPGTPARKPGPRPPDDDGSVLSAAHPQAVPIPPLQVAGSHGRLPGIPASPENPIAGGVGMPAAVEPAPTAAAVPGIPAAPPAASEEAPPLVPAALPQERAVVLPAPLPGTAVRPAAGPALPAAPASASSPAARPAGLPPESGIRLPPAAASDTPPMAMPVPADGSAVRRAGNGVVGPLEAAVSAAPADTALVPAADVLPEARGGADALAIRDGATGLLDRAASVAHASAVRSGASLPPAPMEQVVLHVGRGIAEGRSEIRLDLRPAELGRVEVRLEFQDGKVQATITADRPETLQLLQSDARVLERGLQNAGLRMDQAALQFSLRGEGQHGSAAGFNRQGGDPAAGAPRTDEAAAAVGTRPVVVDGLIDISI